MSTIDTTKKKREETKKREPPRPYGSGGIFKKRNIWWINYYGPDGVRHFESSGSESKRVAARLVQRKVGARDNNLPVIPYAERYTFDEGAQAVVNDLKANGRGYKGTQRRITKHLGPFFSGRRLAGITADRITAYITARQSATEIVRSAHDVIRKDGTVRHVPESRRPIERVSNAEINRELQVLRRIFNLAIEQGRLGTKPVIRLLKESAPRSGFFDREQVNALMKHLPSPLDAVVEFAFVTGWRMYGEVLALEWSEVDFVVGQVRLKPGRTKNGQGRTFPMTADLRRILEDRQAEHKRIQRLGQITPLVFFRMVAKGRGGKQEPKPITSLTKAWRNACAATGLPGRIPHDLRRSAVRTFTRAGLSEHVAMKLSGHLTPSVFRRYDIINEADLRDAASTLDSARATVGRTASQK